MNDKVGEYDLKNKTLNETIEAYYEINNDLEVQKMILEKTHNYELAKLLYEKYLKDKENKSKQNVSK